MKKYKVTYSVGLGKKNQRTKSFSSKKAATNQISKLEKRDDVFGAPRLNKIPVAISFSGNKRELRKVGFFGGFGKKI